MLNPVNWNFPPARSRREGNCKATMRIGNTLYFDYQASTPLDPDVFEAMQPYLTCTIGNPHSTHVVGWKLAKAIENAKQSVAHLLGADSDEIVFVSGATEANNTAILGVAKYLTSTNRKQVIISTIEHKCVMEAARRLRDCYGFELSFVDVDGAGRVKLSNLNNLVNSRTGLVSIGCVNNEIGTIQDYQAIADIVKKSGALLHCDASQAPSIIDMTLLNKLADLISLSGHKMYGPQGVGALFVSRETTAFIEPLFHGGNQQPGIRSGTIPTALAVGMGKACELLLDKNYEKERERIRSMTQHFQERIWGAGINAKVNGPSLEHRHQGNMNVQFRNQNAHDLLQRLQPNLAASVGSACSSGIEEPSYVLRAIGLTREEANSSIRFSIGKFTDLADIELAVDHIGKALDYCPQV